MRLYLLSLNKYFCDNRRSLLLSLAGLAALAIFIGVIYAWQRVNDEGRFASMLLYLGIYACMRCSLMFSSMKSARGRIATLMNPATSGDKFMARWTINFPVLDLTLIAAFWLSEAVRMWCFGLFHPDLTTTWFSISEVLRQETYLSLATVLSVVTVFQSFFGFGAILWPRRSAVKTLLMLWIIGLLLSIIGFNVLNHYIPTTDTDLAAGLWIILTVNCFVSLVLWALTYMRFSESDVVDRLF